MDAFLSPQRLGLLVALGSYSTFQQCKMLHTHRAIAQRVSATKLQPHSPEFSRQMEAHSAKQSPPHFSSPPPSIRATPASSVIPIFWLHCPMLIALIARCPREPDDLPIYCQRLYRSKFKSRSLSAMLNERSQTTC